MDHLKEEERSLLACSLASIPFLLAPLSYCLDTYVRKYYKAHAILLSSYSGLGGQLRGEIISCQTSESVSQSGRQAGGGERERNAECVRTYVQSLSTRRRERERAKNGGACIFHTCLVHLITCTSAQFFCGSAFRETEYVG